MSQPDQGVNRLPIVTLWASYGCGLDELAPKLANELGVPLHKGAFSSDDLKEAANRGKGGEPSGDGWYLVQAIYPRGHKFRWGNKFHGVERGTDEMRHSLIEAVTTDAKRGGVFVGRNGTVILANYPNALHVKLDGPVEKRVKKAMEQFGITEQQARDNMTFEDEVRSQLSISLFDWDPTQNDRYDLIVNTTELTMDEAVAVIAGAARAKVARS